MKHRLVKIRHRDKRYKRIIYKKEICLNAMKSALVTLSYEVWYNTGHE